jgi:hypothetical protein
VLQASAAWWEAAVAATDGGRSGRLDGVVLGLLADPDLPAELAERLAGELPELLAERLDDQVSWQIRVGCERFDLADEERIMAVARESRAREGWDLVVCLTDLPRRSGLRPIVAEASVSDGVALASLPALGARQLYQRARALVIGLVAELAVESLEQSRAGQDPGSRSRLRVAGPIRRVVPSDAGVDVRLLLPGVRGQARLLAGMVRANRPWRLITGLSGALAAALAAGAFAVVTSDIWQLADSLDPLRLSVATVFSVGAMVAWLIIDHELWERPGGRVARDRARLFNAATVLTVVLGVGCLYVALLVATLATAWFLVTGELLSQSLQHRVGWPDYVTIAWLASSIATVGGALGSGLESDEAVRAAAYGYRQQERRGQAPTTD